MGITCTQQGNLMLTTWVSHDEIEGCNDQVDLQDCTQSIKIDIYRRGGHAMASHAHRKDISCIPHWFYMHTTRKSHAYHMGITCTPQGYLMHTTWVLHAHHKEISCIPPGTTWVLHDKIEAAISLALYTQEYFTLEVTFSRVKLKFERVKIHILLTTFKTIFTSPSAVPSQRFHFQLMVPGPSPWSLHCPGLS